MIVKIQRPLMRPNDRECLVYDQKRRHIIQQQISEDIFCVMNARAGMFAMKAFFTAEWSQTLGYWVIGGMIGDQSW